MISAARVRASGKAVLVLGLAACLLIFCLAPRVDERDELDTDGPSKREILELEKMGGKSYVLINDFNQWFASLWRGRRLAYTIGTLTVIGYLSCRWFAGLLDEPTSPAAPKETSDPNPPAPSP